MPTSTSQSKARSPAIPRSAVWLERSGGAITTVMMWALTLLYILPANLNFAPSQSMKTTADPTTRTLWLAILGISVGLLAWRFSRAVALLRRLNVYLLLILVLSALSVTWSIAPDFTTLRVIRFLTVVLACMCFALFAWTPRRFQDFLRSILLFVCVASIIFVMTSPEVAIHHEPSPELNHSWKGITYTKNNLGSLAGVCILAWLHGWMSRQVSVIYALMGITAGALCLVGSRSQTSIMATVFAVMFMLLLLRTPGTLRRTMPYLVGGFAAVILIYALAVLRLVHGLEGLLTPIQTLTGKDLTFSGRTKIWGVLNDHIHLSPLLGSGYGAYWVGEYPWSPSYEMKTRLYFYPTEGHNGYLDVINDLGYVGGALMFGYFIQYIRDGLKLFKSDRYQAGIYLAVLFRGFLADMSESHWFNALSVDFVLMTLATAALARSLLQIDLEQRARARIARAAATAAAAGPATVPRPRARTEGLPGGLRRRR
jgi:O-antigen ligase